MPKFEQDDQKKLFDGCSSTLEFFLESTFLKISILTKNVLKNFELEKGLK